MSRVDKKKTPQKPKKHAEAAQVGRFAIVGVLNTVVDFVVYNGLLFFFVALSPEIASVVSGTAAMINSFIFNKNFTFRARKLSTWKLVLFFVLTAIGIYVLRPIIVLFFTKWWTWPTELVFKITSALHLPLSYNFVSHNVAWVAAVILVLAYNYLTYKYFVFNDPKADAKK